MKYLMSLFLGILVAMAITGTAHASISNENNPQVAEIALGSITADADVYGFYFHKKVKIISVKLVNGANITASDTDKAVITLQTGSTVHATHSTAATAGNGNLVANTPDDATLSATAANNYIAAGSYVKVAYDESGTYAMTSAKLIIVYHVL